MGNSSSTNVQNLAQSAIVKTMTEIIQDASSIGSQTNIVKIGGTWNCKGPITIDINQMNQAHVDMSATIDAFVSQEAQQKLAANLQQKAKAITSGINLAQFSSASNEVNLFSKAAVELSTKIASTCKNSLSQTNSATVNLDLPTCDDLLIANITQKNVANMLTSCIQKATSNNKTLQDIQAKVSQVATAESKGFSLWALLGILLVGLLVMVAPEIAGVGLIFLAIAKFMWPIILAAGVLMIILYFVLGKVVVDGIGFSTLITAYDVTGKNIVSGPACGARAYKTQNGVIWPGQASENCRKDSQCVAVDWQAYAVDKNSCHPGTTGGCDARMLPQAKTTMYSSIGQSPCPGVTQDQANILKPRSLYFALGSDPTNIDADSIVINTRRNTIAVKQAGALVNKTTGFGGGDVVYWWNGKDVDLQGPTLLVDSAAKMIGTPYDSPLRIDLANNPTLKATPGLVWAWTDNQRGGYLSHWKKVGDTYVETKMSAPGNVSVAPQASHTAGALPQYNASGFKRKERHNWLLPVGIVVASLGLSLTIWTFGPKRSGTSGRASFLGRAKAHAKSN